MVHQLTQGNNLILEIDSSLYYSTDVLSVKADEQYELTCDKRQRWIDWYISSSPDGYFNPLAIIVGIRIKQAKCFQLCAVYDRDDSTAIAIGSNLLLSVDRPGDLSFFANDARNPIYYRNNKGSVKLNIKRIK